MNRIENGIGQTIARSHNSIIRLFGNSIIATRAGFTLIELLVVVAMIAVLMGAMGVSTMKARTRAKIARATQETKEMTNAILAFENYAKGHTLEKYANGSWAPCTEGAMAMILGHETGENGEQVPVLYNASVRGGKLLDPWGRPYEFMIEKTSPWAATDVPDLLTAPALPNYFRLSEKERE